MTRWLALLLLFALLMGCSPQPLPANESSPTPTGQMETRVAATIYAEGTSTAAIEQALEMTLTAAVPPPTHTPAATPTPNAFRVAVPASACWMNSEVNVRTGQKVVITASGTINTWGGREGSSSGPNGQTGLCGAIQCPKQGVGYGGLIGRLEDLPTFLVGTKYEFVATKDGQLYFTVNDWECDDNSGVFYVLITFP